MRHYLRVILVAICLVAVPVAVFAQGDKGDICSTLPSVDSVRSLGGNGAGNTSDVVVEQMRERADILARQEKDRAGWVVQIFPVKYLDMNKQLKALCIFSAEIVPQPALHMISVRTSPASISAIGDAIKRLDVPQVGPKSVELTIHVLVASDQDETLRPVPASLKPVVDQLKGVLSYRQFYLLDTWLGTTVDVHQISMNGYVRGLNPPPGPNGGLPRDSSYRFQANIHIGSGEPATAPVRLSGLIMGLEQIVISTDVDIPPGKQVVVGKSTSGERAFILVVSAKILN